MKVSVAIPCYKSKNSIKIVVSDVIKAIRKREDVEYQIILVNDYPHDETFDVIRELCEKDENIIGINLSKNFGQTPAKMAALPYVDGDVLVYMDDDGQHPADEIYKLIDKVYEGYDVVFAFFPHKKHSKFKRFTSWLNSKLLEINRTKPKEIHTSSYYALSKNAIKSLLEYKSPYPSTFAYLYSVTDKFANVTMKHQKRISGKSTYSLKKLFSLWFTNFTNFSIVPIRCVSVFGVLSALIGFIFGLAIIIKKIMHPHALMSGYASSVAIELFLGGCVMMILGFIGEYIGRIYMLLNNLPQYKIQEIVNGKDKIKDSI